MRGSVGRDVLSRCGTVVRANPTIASVLSAIERHPNTEKQVTQGMKRIAQCSTDLMRLKNLKPVRRMSRVNLRPRQYRFHHGWQAAVRLPVIDPQPPALLTKEPSSRLPSLMKSRLSSCTRPFISQRK